MTEVKFFEDRDRNTNFFKLDSLGSKIRPYYDLGEKRFDYKYRKSSSNKNFKRYYIISKNHLTKNIKEVDSLELEINKKCQSNDESKVNELKQSVLESPEDVDAWLKYIHFEENQEFSCSKKLKKEQVEFSRKLAIVDKALKFNPDSDELLRVKLNLLSKNLAIDQYYNEVNKMIDRNPENIVLWKAMILSVKSSCVTFKVSKVVDLYSRCFSVMKKIRKGSIESLDKRMLMLLCESLTFLRQTGHWEQVWEIIKLNLHLNLKVSQDILNKIETVDEKNLLDMEDIIIKSGLPLNMLWLRVESLRERSYWTSISFQNDQISYIGDEKRLVSYDEIATFVYPIISNKLNFELALLSMVNLKVPLLPSRHFVLKDCGLEEMYLHHADTLEFILPFIKPTVWLGEQECSRLNEDVLSDLLKGELTSGPQLLKFHPFQELFLNFIRSVFHAISEKLSSVERTSFLTWWLRFERLLIYISKNDSLKEPSSHKKLKSLLKSFLKKPENRNNFHFYREYALIEYEFGFIDCSIEMLQTMTKFQNIDRLNNTEMEGLLSLFRTQFEILFKKNDYKIESSNLFNELVQNFKLFCSKYFHYDLQIPINEMLYNEILKFLMEPVTAEAKFDYFLPNINCDILMCYAFLMLKENNTDNLNEVLNLCDKCLQHSYNNLSLQEMYYECKVICLQLYHLIYKKSDHTVQVLQNTADEAITQFPGNFFISSVKISLESNQPFWKHNCLNSKFDIWSVFIKVLSIRARIAYMKKNGLEDSFELMINKAFSIFKSSIANQETQLCPLLWKLYILSIKEYNKIESKGEDIYCQSILHCPWAKNLYINAADIAPQALSQIQDLIKERELRMHITPEELSILREI